MFALKTLGAKYVLSEPPPTPALRGLGPALGGGGECSGLGGGGVAGGCGSGLGGGGAGGGGVVAGEAPGHAGAAVASQSAALATAQSKPFNCSSKQAAVQPVSAAISAKASTHCVESPGDSLHSGDSSNSTVAAGIGVPPKPWTAQKMGTPGIPSTSFGSHPAWCTTWMCELRLQIARERDYYDMAWCVEFGTNGNVVSSFAQARTIGFLL